MSTLADLGRLTVRAGEILTLTYRDNTPLPRHITVVALVDLNLSEHMATFCADMDRSGHGIFTEQALPAFVQYLTDRRLLHVGKEVRVDFGKLGRPASRLLNEYRFKLNPEAFWEAKLLHRYKHNSFTLFSHQNHLLTIMAGIDAPFSLLAHVVAMDGTALGSFRLEILTDNKYTLISDEDLERIRLALQADLSLSIEEISVMIESVELFPNPDFGISSFARHLPTLTPPSEITTP